MARKFILGRKEGMTQVFTPEGELIPVTVVEAGPCTVVQVKTPETDGYSAIQVGFKDKKLNRTTKPLKGHFKKAGLLDGKSEGDKESGPRALHYLREFRVPETSEYNSGDVISANLFEEGDRVDVIGMSKGRGFAGVMKRWNFKGGPAGHGGMCDRRPGSIGMHSDPSRVFKGKKMPGHFGNKRITVKGLEIVNILPERNVLLIRGSVPGGRNGLLYIITAKSGPEKKVKKEAEPAANK